MKKNLLINLLLTSSLLSSCASNLKVTELMRSKNEAKYTIRCNEAEICYKEASKICPQFKVESSTLAMPDGIAGEDFQQTLISISCPLEA